MKPPKEKALELIEKYAPIMPNENWKDRAIQCALIDVQNTIDYAKTFGDATETDVRYFTDVKQEIEKL
jgi:hypothetical protein